MADAAASGQTPPTFKLVLVGDGGTGKVSCLQLLKIRKERRSCATPASALYSFPRRALADA